MVKYQSGFRRGRCGSSILKPQVNKESVLAVFFYIEKAYDVERRSIN